MMELDNLVEDMIRVFSDHTGIAINHRIARPGMTAALNLAQERIAKMTQPRAGKTLVSQILDKGPPYPWEPEEGNICAGKLAKPLTVFDDEAMWGKQNV